MKERRNVNGLVSGLLAFGIIFAFCLVIGLQLYSADRCIEPRCNNTMEPGSSYCRIHEPYKWGSTRYGGYSSRTYSTGAGVGSASGATNNHSNTNTYSGGGSGNKPSGSTTRTRTYNTLNNDPADYDDPEDYADDAWGDDFDDWGDAYDYWEDY